MAGKHWYVGTKVQTPLFDATFSRGKMASISSILPFSRTFHFEPTAVLDFRAKWLFSGEIVDRVSNRMDSHYQSTTTISALRVAYQKLSSKSSYDLDRDNYDIYK